MTWTRRWRKRLRTLARREAVERELDEELAFHLELETEKNLRAGMTPDEARRRAALRFGGVEKTKEAVRDERKLGWVSGLSLDLRLGLRMLAKHPGLALVGAGSMAVGIALSAVVFSVLDMVVDPRLPLDEGERIVLVRNDGTGTRDSHLETHLHDLVTWRQSVTAVGEFGAFRPVYRNVIAPGALAEPLRVAEMTASGFRIARVPPLQGRWLLDEDEREGAPAVVVIGHDVWRDRFAGSPDAIGRTLQIDGEVHTVVGVMPEGFGFPVNNRLWAPLRLDPLDYPEGAAPFVEVFGRLAAGASLEQAEAQFATVARRLAAASVGSRERIRTVVAPYASGFLENPGGAWTLQIARLMVGALLLVIAVNVAILVYARTATRTAEIAVRLALGASRGRVVTQLFAEALVLSSAAAGLGLLTARFILRLLAVLLDRFGGEQIPFWWRMELSSATIMYASVLAVLAAAVIGVLPALRATSGRVQSTLRDLSGATSMRLGRTWTVLIAVQVAMAVALIPWGAALPLLRLVNASAPAPPVPLEEIVAARITLGNQEALVGAADRDAEALIARFADRHAEVVRRLEAEPGVRGVSFASSPPGVDSHRGVLPEGEGATVGRTRYLSNSLEVDPGLFDLFGAALLAGRTFEPADLAERSPVAIVNRSFVQAVFGEGEALGRRFRFAGQGVGPGGVEAEGWYEVVGIVEDFPRPGLTGPEDNAAVYHPVSAPRSEFATILAHAPGVRPEAFVGRLREITTTVDPALRVSEASTVGEYLRQDAVLERILEYVLVSLIGSVVLLSAAGMNALVSLTVTQRRREIGVRIALGARSGQVLRTIALRALRQIAVGLAAGTVLAGLLIPVITPSAARAALMFSATAAIMLIVGVFSVVGPARRGLRIQPMEALREE